MALILAKGGWWGGNPGKVLAAPVDEVLQAMQFDAFKSAYERKYMKLNEKTE